MLDAFREARDDCVVRDLGYKGSPFTWQRGNTLLTLIRERLDRMMVMEEWFDLFPSWEVIHLPRYRSDHSPLLSKTGVNDTSRKGNKLFKFEALWLSKEECGKIVEDAWKGDVGGNMASWI